MSNTNSLYWAIREYQEARCTAREEYLSCLRRIENTKGSRFYDEQVSAAKKKRAEAVGAAQAAARTAANAVIRSMRERIDSLSLSAPSEEAIRIIDLLEKRVNIGENEMRSAAVAMRGNGSALLRLQEMARERGIVGIDFLGMVDEKLSYKDAVKALESTVDSCGQILNNTSGADHNFEYVKKLNRLRNGADYDPDDLPQERTFENEAEFIEAVSHVRPELFSEAVN